MFRVYELAAFGWIMCVFTHSVSHAYTAQEEGSCLDVMRVLLSNGQPPGGATVPMVRMCEDCQGRPGKRGALGPRGVAGPPGRKGDTGDCVCDLSEVEELREEVRVLREELLERIQRIPGACYAGISDWRIPASALRASSVHSTCPFADVRLGATEAWCTATNRVGEWVRVDLSSPRKIYGVVTQGRGNHNQWVKTYKVSYGNAENSMQTYRIGGVDKVFGGNSDRNTKVVNRFIAPITARYFAIHPIAYQGHMSMRIELLDC